MLDPFGAKSRPNPEKIGKNGPFWILTPDELLGPSSIEFFPEIRTKVIPGLPAIFLCFCYATLVSEQC